MRRVACRPGVNDIRCKYQDKNPYGYLFEQPVQDQSGQAPTVAVPKQAPTGVPQAGQEVSGTKTGGLRTSVKPAPLAKPTQDSLTEEQITKAKLAKASDIFHKEGTDKAEAYLKDNNLDYTIDWELSNDSGLVLIDNVNGKAVVAYRGTDLKTPADWATGVAMLSSTESLDQVFKNGKTQMEQVISEYGAPSELIGFSRGGTLAMTLGNEFGVDTTTFNPFVGVNLIKTLSADAQHTIIRTTTDPVSIGANIPNPKFKTIQIAPKEDSLNPMTNHTLKQFLDNDTPRRQPPLDKLQKFVESTGKVQSELITLKEMTQALNQGKSFSEFLNDFSPVDIRGGKLSSRIFEGSNFTNWWKEMGGSFNQIEQAHLSGRTSTGRPSAAQMAGADVDLVPTRAQMAGADVNLPSTRAPISETGTTAQQRAEFGSLTPEQQAGKIAEMGDIHMKAIDSFSSYQSGERQIAELYAPTKLSPGLSEAASSAFTEQLSASSLGSGLIGSYVGNKVVETLDPNQKLQRQGDEAVSGFLAGGVGAALAGGALFPAAIAGSAGMLAGSETTRALEKAGVGQTGAQTLGGATGGATAGLAAATIGAGGAALAGAEFGAAFAPETFGISIAVGAAIGGLAGLASGLWSDIFGSDTPPAQEQPKVDVLPANPTVAQEEAAYDAMNTPWWSGTIRAPGYQAPQTYSRYQQRVNAGIIPPPPPVELTQEQKNQQELMDAGAKYQAYAQAQAKAAYLAGTPTAITQANKLSATTGAPPV